MSATAPARRWADGPFGLIPSSALGPENLEPTRKQKPILSMAEEMRTYHNMLIRGINSIYLQCINVERDPHVVADFVGYADAWAHILEIHHDNEETTIFPHIEAKLKQPGLMDGNVAQHRAFHGGLEAYQSYVQSVQSGSQKYEGAKLKAIIDDFMPVLRQHLADEIPTIVGLSQYKDSIDWDRCVKEIRSKMTRVGSSNPRAKDTALPLFFHLNDATYDDGEFANWPPMPGFVAGMIKWLFEPRHQSWWQFAPCDANGKPRDLPYAD